MTKPNKLTAIEKLSTTSKANFSAFVSITHGQGGSHKCVFWFKMSGWLQGYRGWVWLLQERKKWQGYLSDMKMCTYLTSNLNLFLQTLWMVDWSKIELFSCILAMKSSSRESTLMTAFTFLCWSLVTIPWPSITCRLSLMFHSCHPVNSLHPNISMHILHSFSKHFLRCWRGKFV